LLFVVKKLIWELKMLRIEVRIKEDSLDGVPKSQALPLWQECNPQLEL